MTWLPRDGANRWLEPLLAASIAVGIIVAMVHLIVDGYLPQPFFYQAFDVWMDWFNTAYWARDPGTYDNWRTLYPPVSFLFLKLATLERCYAFAEQYSSRDCDWWGAITMHGWFVLNIFLCAKTFLKIDRSTALYRSFAVAAGMPMLDALERGNLLMVCFTCFLLGFGPLLRSARCRWLAAGLAVNFKVYLIASIAAHLIRRRWRWFEGAVLATIGVYVLSWGLLGRGTPAEIYAGLYAWSTEYSANSLLDLWYATTYWPVHALLDGSVFPGVLILGSGRVDAATLAIPLFVHGVQALIVFSAAAAWLRPEAVSTFRIVNLCTCLPLITSEAGGYVQALVILLTFFERWRGIGVKVAIVACYILCIPGDIYIDPAYPTPNLGFLNKGPIFYAYWFTVGPFVRPALVLIIPIALACVTIRDVWQDIRMQGWQARGRFRHDLPLFAAGGGTDRSRV